MKDNLENEVLKVIAITMKKSVQNSQKDTAICPLIFHQPKRPQK